MSLKDTKVSDNFSEAFTEADTPVIHSQGSGIQEPWEKKTDIAACPPRAQTTDFTTNFNVIVHLT